MFGTRAVQAQGGVNLLVGFLGLLVMTATFTVCYQIGLLLPF